MKSSEDVAFTRGGVQGSIPCASTTTIDKSGCFLCAWQKPCKIVPARSRAAKPQRWPRARPGRKSSSPSRRPQHPFPACPPSYHANRPSQPPGDCLCRLSLRQRLKVQTRSTNRGGGWRVPQIGFGDGIRCVAKPPNIEMPNHQAGFLQRRRNAGCFCVAPLPAIAPAISEKRKRKWNTNLDWQANKED